MESTLAQAIDELLGERQLIVATLDVDEDRASTCFTLQLTEPENERGLPNPPRGGEQEVSPIGQLPLQTGEIARAVKEVVVFDRGARDISHGPEDSNLTNLRQYTNLYLYEIVSRRACRPTSTRFGVISQSLRGVAGPAHDPDFANGPSNGDGEPAGVRFSRWMTYSLDRERGRSLLSTWHRIDGSAPSSHCPSVV